jgi:hypothetical protein
VTQAATPSTPAGVSPPAAVRLGLGANLAQFGLLALVNAFVGGMVGLERSILPAMAEEEFRLVARGAVLSFIVVFGVTKALTNYLAGRFSDAVGRKTVSSPAGSSRPPRPSCSCGRRPGPGCSSRTGSSG